MFFKTAKLSKSKNSQTFSLYVYTSISIVKSHPSEVESIHLQAVSRNRQIQFISQKLDHFNWIFLIYINKWIVLYLLFFSFVFQQYNVNLWKIANNWIWTVDFWCQKQPLCQLCQINFRFLLNVTISTIGWNNFLQKTL